MKKHFYCVLVFLIFGALTLYGCRARSQAPATSEIPKAEEASDFTLSVQPAEEGLSLQTKIAELNTTTSAEESVANTTVSNSELSEDSPLPTPQEVQKALKNAGLYNGSIDGIIGTKTKEAIKQFQRDNNLTVDGVVGRKTWSRLKKYLD